MLKLNLGCGLNKKEGFLNVDKFASCEPDAVLDLEETPWPFDTSTAGHVTLNHVLEHLGREVDVFFSIMRELYRVTAPDALIEVNVPHPRHDNFINDPTHVRIITPEILGLFSRKNCLRWKSMGASNSPLALYLDVDFEIETTDIILEQPYHQSYIDGKVSETELRELLRSKNNIASEYRITMRTRKSQA